MAWLLGFMASLDQLNDNFQRSEEKERMKWVKMLLLVLVVFVQTACPRNAGQQSLDFPADSPRQMKEHGGL